MSFRTTSDRNLSSQLILLEVQETFRLVHYCHVRDIKSDILKGNIFHKYIKTLEYWYWRSKHLFKKYYRNSFTFYEWKMLLGRVTGADCWFLPLSLVPLCLVRRRGGWAQEGGSRCDTVRHYWLLHSRWEPETVRQRMKRTSDNNVISWWSLRYTTAHCTHANISQTNFVHLFQYCQLSIQ